jgi:hypothetical protein
MVLLYDVLLPLRLFMGKYYFEFSLNHVDDALFSGLVGRLECLEALCTSSFSSQ